MLDRLLLSSVLVTSLAAQPAPAGLQVLEALRSKVTPWESVLDPGGKRRAELAALDAALPGVRVVAIGEQTHGSKEFHEVWLRLVRQLVEHHGFDVVLLETGFLQTLALQEAVARADGDVHDGLVATGFWPAQVESMRGLLAWIRDWNVAHPDAVVTVMGMDPQGPGSAELLAERLSAAGAPAEVAHGATAGIEAWLREEAELEAGERAMLRRAAALLEVESQLAELPLAEGWNLRDRTMAEQVEWALERHDKAIVLAHDAHVRAAGRGPLRPLGGLLEAEFVDGCLRIGTVFAEGSFLAKSLADRPFGSRDDLERLDEQADGIRAFEVEPLAGLPDLLVASQHAFCLVDLREPDEVVARWARRPQRLRLIGGGWNAAWADRAEAVAPAELGDLLVFVREVSASKLLE